MSGRLAKDIAPKSRSDKAAFLLEIGTEELPASFVGPALENFTSLAQRFFGDHRLSHGTIQTVGTPRRLVLFVDELASRQTSIFQEILGPPKSVAYDDRGQPSQAGKGFAKSQEISVDQLQIRETPKGVYVCALKRQEGRNDSGSPSAASVWSFTAIVFSEIHEMEFLEDAVRATHSMDCGPLWEVVIFSLRLQESPPELEPGDTGSFVPRE